MVKIVHIQSVLLEDDVHKLKVAANCQTIKEAVSKSVEHYINVVGSLTDEQEKKLKNITGETSLDAAISKAISQMLS